MIKDYIEYAIAQIKAEREQKIENVKSSIMQDKIVPYNISMEEKRDLALQELLDKHNSEIEELNAKYEAERQTYIDACEKDKADNEKTVLARETYGITAEYDKVIAELNKQLA